MTTEHLLDKSEEESIVNRFDDLSGTLLHYFSM
jgi:hypothetical protein